MISKRNKQHQPRQKISKNDLKNGYNDEEASRNVVSSAQKYRRDYNGNDDDNDGGDEKSKSPMIARNTKVKND